ncbi:MAG: hypothetical protein K9M51_01235 [Candidatus Gracilibacteria bacterium]|nr:hypothetical protein [Candidatus Gracilibacteria bacterium]
MAEGDDKFFNCEFKFAGIIAGDDNATGLESSLDFKEMIVELLDFLARELPREWERFLDDKGMEFCLFGDGCWREIVIECCSNLCMNSNFSL